MDDAQAKRYHRPAVDQGGRTSRDARNESDPAWILDVITGVSADGITIQDATGRLIYANDAAGRMSGFPNGAALQAASPEAVLSAFEILDEEGAPLPVDKLSGRRALRGETEPEAIVRFRRAHSPEEHWSLVRATPLMDEDGSVQLVVNVFVDITAQRRRDVAQRLLDQASHELARSLDWDATIARIAQLAVPTMADWCAVDIAEGDGSFSLVALAHVDPERVAWAYDLRRRFPIDPDDPSGVAAVFRTGVPELIPEITQEMFDAAAIEDPELIEVIERLQLSSVMLVPLIARGRTLGVLQMVWAESGRHYDEEDLRTAQRLAERAALALDNARLYQERVHLADVLQARLLPGRLPAVPGFDIAARYLPAQAAEAGGDFYDLFEMDDGTWKAVIGDVCGRGPSAAALMGFVRFTLRAVSRQDTSPSQALVKVNRALVEELRDDPGGFCTAAIIRLAIGQGHVARATVAVAGHPLPMVLRPGAALSEVGAPGDLLGVMEDISVSDSSIDLELGDTLVMVTDGVLEASREPDWVRETLHPFLIGLSGSSAEDIAAAIEQMTSRTSERRSDDIAVLVLKFVGAA